MKEHIPFHLDVILNTMCMMVDAKYDREKMKKDDWYLEYQWDEETEKQFEDWMTDYLHKLPKAQVELYGRRYMKKDECRKAVKMFLLSYGWKTKTSWRTENV
jgi:hypothetical protein